MITSKYIVKFKRKQNVLEIEYVEPRIFRYKKWPITVLIS